MKSFEAMTAYLSNMESQWVFLPYQGYLVAYPAYLITGTTLPYFKGMLELAGNRDLDTSFSEIYAPISEAVEYHTPAINFAVVFNPKRKSYMIVGDIMTSLEDGAIHHFALR
ncbi:MAG: hypothetical protein ACRCVV_22105 [Shewanella sp.]